ncbi:hypothetical protein AQZ52_15850 [Novosphingobium fuchskuhlense]|uniref:T2SS protein K first SAM-like domain-containing protein n=2 Tax=Novosphingobium fuchskuhlense TaxID=1117702 RepID=A0A117UT10_9SPHN|nr:hypothetical protein AQZ52_15850 [Novosphingobium fuchskuhlense]
MVAAVGAIAIMAAVAAMFTTASVSQIDTLDAETTRARLVAAADAGIAVALGGLSEQGGNRVWTLEGEDHELTFDGVALKVHVEDEQGKIVFEHVNEENMGWLLDALGVPEPQRSIARDSYGDWIDDDEDARENGAESEYYNPRGLRPANTWISSVDELADIRGFTPELVERIRAYGTADTSEYFDATHANLLAIQVMTDGDANSPDIISRRRELSGQRTAIGFSAPELKNHVVSIVAEARLDGGRTVTRRAVVVVAPPGRHRYAIKYVE